MITRNINALLQKYSTAEVAVFVDFNIHNALVVWIVPTRQPNILAFSLSIGYPDHFIYPQLTFYFCGVTGTSKITVLFRGELTDNPYIDL